MTLPNPHTTDPNNIEDSVKSALENNDYQILAALVEALPTVDALRILSKLEFEEREQVVALMPAELAAELVEDAPEELAASIIHGLDSNTAANILEKLTSDTQADIINKLPEENAEAILSELDSEEAEGIRRLSAYPPETAGGLMEWEIFSFVAHDSVGTVLRRLGTDDDTFERYRGQHPYVLDSQGCLVGVVSLRNLLTRTRTTLLSEVMVPAQSVTPHTGLETLEDIFDDFPFLGLPVIDHNDKPLGVVSRISVSEASLERAEQESLSRQQVGDELHSMPLWHRSRKRLTWLSSNIVLNVIAASVISAYEQTIAAVIAIAVFLPMVSDMSGCSGNQAVGVSMRELALGLAKPRDLFHILRKEFGVGIINGILLGICIGLVAWAWKGNPYLGLVIGLALALNTLVAVSIGGTIPLILKYFGIDPAVASGPLLTTVTDMIGFFLVLSLATLFMPQLLSV